MPSSSMPCCAGRHTLSPGPSPAPPPRNGLGPDSCHSQAGPDSFRSGSEEVRAGSGQVWGGVWEEGGGSGVRRGWALAGGRVQEVCWFARSGRVNFRLSFDSFLAPRFLLVRRPGSVSFISALQAC